MAKNEGIALSEMIEQLRDELTTSMAMGHGHALRFIPTEVLVEAQVTVAREAKGKGGIKFWLVNAEGEVSSNSSQVQKITLKLQPTGPEGSGGDVLLVE